MRTRVGRPNLRLIDTSADRPGGESVARAHAVSPRQADLLLARALPAEAHAALQTAYHQRQMDARRLSANVDRLRYAVVDLAAIDLPPEKLIDALSPTFDEPIVREHIYRALDSLLRIAEEWQRREGVDQKG